MVNLLSKDQLNAISPEGRIKNSTESLYFRTQSGDPEVDEIIRQETLIAFKEHDVVLTDNPKPELLRSVMLHAAKESTKELQRSLLTPEQTQTIERNFDTMAARPKFYEKTFEGFEIRHFGEPVDFTADYERMVRENGGKPPWELEMSDEAMRAMESDYVDREIEERDRDELGERVPRALLAPGVTSEPKRSDAFVYADLVQKVERTPDKPLAQEKTPRSGLSYGKAVPEAVAQKKVPAYVHAAQERAAANEQKGKVDKAYEQHAKRNGNGSKFTAGDQFGYDEPENDGPEL